MFYTALLSAVPVVLLLAYIFLTDQSISLSDKIIVVGLCLLWLLAVAASIHDMFVYHLRTISNLIEAIRTEDYSMRSSRVRDPGELAELYQQIDALTEQLSIVRQEEIEVSNLLERIVNKINVAIVACDSNDNIHLANRLVCKLLNMSSDELIGLPISRTALVGILNEKGSRLVDYEFPGASGRWQINEQHYRHQGKPGRIIFITDLKQVLSEEEISAWQRLIRVITHEVNNSLTPISSICQTLESHLADIPEEKGRGLKEGLSVIKERSRGLRDFIAVYARIAKLPEPQRIRFSVSDLLQKVSRFFVNQPVSVELASADVDIFLFGDPVHIEQVLINLIKNALEASNEEHSKVELTVCKRDGVVEFSVQDEGRGISNPANLFVPFYTTKEKGAGIGLTLSRQIAARHGGQIILENRPDGRGAIARFRIPSSID
ncbi:MAG: ATP-binding protein [Gammaproteobacteria bacterium]|nr:ATP-binding protein [Gammaproteobacteria bacterium]